LFHNMDAEPVKNFLTMPTDPKEMGIRIAESIWALGTTGKFVWPIPDKGLRGRLHRVTAPALVVWGEHDRIVAPVYAEEFAGLLGDARVEIVPGAGHVPQWEQLDVVVGLVEGFLAG
jgi:pimeloyl-ACP methyl ester carboxylesterase